MNRMLLVPSLAAATALLLALSTAPASAVDLDAAKTNYTTFCVKCHGPNGKGDGPAAASLKTKPRDFQDCARMAKISDQMVFSVIKNGGAANGLSADMPAWSQGFEDEEIRDLAAFVRTFCKK